VKERVKDIPKLVLKKIVKSLVHNQC